LPGTPAVWQTHFGVSGDSVQARKHGNSDRCCQVVDVPGRVVKGSGKEDDEGIVEGQTFRIGDKRRSLRGSHSDPWRLRIYKRLACRKILARLETLHDWRGHV